MYIKRHLSLLIIYFFTWRLILISLFTGMVAVVTYDFLGWKWVAIPWLPVSLIGTATAFFVGFKNNQAYDRNWEARKIWGSITNLSRAFISTARAFITPEFATSPVSQQQMDDAVRQLTYHHIGWLYILKHAMEQRTTWEHTDLAAKRQRKATHKGRDDYQTELEIYFTAAEIEWLKTKKNPATQLLDKQSQFLAKLKQEGLLDDFRQMELQRIIKDLYAEQGGSERIKNTPFPRQFATVSTIFIIIFMILLPFGMIGEFLKLGDGMLWLLIPFNLVVTWVFTLMEYTGDMSENPFEGLLGDVPVRTIVRNIEIDLKDMISEETPEKIAPFYGIVY